MNHAYTKQTLILDLISLDTHNCLQSFSQIWYVVIGINKNDINNRLKK